MDKAIEFKKMVGRFLTPLKILFSSIPLFPRILVLRERKGLAANMLKEFFIALRVFKTLIVEPYHHVGELEEDGGLIHPRPYLLYYCLQF